MVKNTYPQIPERYRVERKKEPGFEHTKRVRQRARNEDLARRAEGKYTATDIAKILGSTRRPVAYWAKKLGIPPTVSGYRPFSEGDARRIIEAYYGSRGEAVIRQEQRILDRQAQQLAKRKRYEQGEPGTAKHRRRQHSLSKQPPQPPWTPELAQIPVPPDADQDLW
jgi:DNA-binding transcriptional MerR regulator